LRRFRQDQGQEVGRSRTKSRRNDPDFKSVDYYADKALWDEAYKIRVLNGDERNNYEFLDDLVREYVEASQKTC
jgi:hypothetical protein